MMRATAYDTIQPFSLDVLPAESTTEMARAFSQTSPEATTDRATIHATALAGAILVGLAVLMAAGVATVVGTLGFAIVRLWG